MHGGLRAATKKADLALIVADGEAASAGAFTTNVLCAAPVTFCKQVLEAKQTARAVCTHPEHAEMQSYVVHVYAINQCVSGSAFSHATACMRINASLCANPSTIALLDTTAPAGIPIHCIGTVQDAALVSTIVD